MKKSSCLWPGAASASNGVEGLQAIIDEEPSLVVLDWRMPVLDGRGLAQGLRQLGRRIPIALVTGEPNGAVLAREIGAVAVIAKPVAL